MDMEPLGKAEKKLCRRLIELGLERSCRKFVEEMREIVGEDIHDAEEYQEIDGVPVEGPWHKKFIEIYRAASKFNKGVANRFDGATGSRYLITVKALYCDGLLTDEDITEFTEQRQAFIRLSLD